jgi:hypothetical protein
MFLNRIVGVFKLSAHTFEEIENDRNATGQAALVVAIVAVLVGLGAGFTTGIGTTEFFFTFISILIWAFIGWIVWSAITLFIGTRLLAGHADMGEMLRVIGFANAPLALGIIPFIGGLIGVLWTAAAVFVAIRQGLDFTGARALLTMVVGFIFYSFGYLVIFIMGLIFRQFGIM